jgi:hypothetical protein
VATRWKRAAHGARRRLVERLISWMLVCRGVDDNGMASIARDMQAPKAEMQERLPVKIAAGHALRLPSNTPNSRPVRRTETPLSHIIHLHHLSRAQLAVLPVLD